MPKPLHLRRQVNRRLRRAVDRVMMPYVDRIRESGVPAPVHEPTPEPSSDDGAAVSTAFHMTNHTLRELELARLRGDWNRVLSVGANGSWYFDWFRGAVGEVDEHVGLEAYLPQPDDLPGYVTWIANSADRMNDVETGSVDLVFAGQTSEHMWPEELAGFLTEAHRVLRLGGTLALDSPNRRVTQHLNWSHGEHTIELDHDEISELLQLAGFDVTSVAGMWRCHFDGRVWQLEEGIDVPEVLTKRIASGRDHPAESFCWWVNAECAGREVDGPALEAAVESLFAKHWDTRVSRGFFPAVGADLAVAAGSHDVVAETLPFPLRAGMWRVTLTLAAGSWDSVEDVRLSIVAPGDQIIHEATIADARRDGEAMSWDLERPHLRFALAIRVGITAREPISVAFPLCVSPL